MALQKQIVITGAAGFIGSQLALALAQRFHPGDLLLVDHPLRSPKELNLRKLEAIRFLDHLAFLSQLESGAISPDLILHLGACSDTTEPNWSYLEENNLRYSQRLWLWCAMHSRRLIYASSAATYGDGSAGFDDEAEISRLKPLNLYGKSKHDFDLWIQEQKAEKPAQCVGLKFFNVFGPGEAHKGRMASMVFHGYNQIRATGQIRLFKSERSDYEDGGQLRDFIWIGDVVRVIEQFIEHPEISGLFNLGTGQARSFNDLARAVFSALGVLPRIQYFEMPADLSRKYQYFTEATMQKLRRAGIEYAPTSLDEAVAHYVSFLERESSASPQPLAAA